MSADLLTIPEVARRKGVSPSAIYKAIAQGRLRGQRVLDKWAVSAHEAEQWTPHHVGGRRKGTPMSEEGKARIAEGQRRRWEARKGPAAEDQSLHESE